MTPRDEFGDALLQLAVSLGFEVDEPTAAVYWHQLKAVPREIRREGFNQAASMPWRRLPQPGELKALCAGVQRAKREAAARLHLADCTHSGHWIDTDLGMTRCPCWTRALQAMDAVGQAIALPARAGEDE